MGRVWGDSMSDLFFVGSQEHALLTLVVKRAEASPSVKYFGRTALQKVVYFLKALGVPAKYQFEIHHYGPFCDQIGSDVELLMADGIVVDRAPSPNYWNYGINPKGPADELVSKHDEFRSRYSDLIDVVVDGFGGLEPRDLELYATLHYAYRYQTATHDKPTKEAVIARFRDYKGAKFTTAELNDAYDGMVKAKLIPA
jgi:hypothetical protein